VFMPLTPQAADLTSYDLLLSVARLGSLGRAAAEHHMSQPAASARMRQLEHTLGVVLLRRSPRGSTLTETGALVADWARVAVDAADALAASVAALRTVRHSRLRVAASQTIAEYLLPAWLIALRTGQPGLGVTLRAENSTEVAADVLAGRADLGFVEGPDVQPGLDAVTIATDRLVVVVAPHHPWARRRTITVAELAAAPLITREAGSGTRRALETALVAHGVDTVAAPLLELSSTTSIKHAVAAGDGAAVLSSLAVTGELAARALTAVRVADLSVVRELRAVWPHGPAPTGPVASLFAVARRHR
jgi:DNA-binding transcriptional LysR family regulator